MSNNKDGERLIDDGLLYVQGIEYKQLARTLRKFALRESGLGLDYDVTIQEMPTHQNYHVKFRGKMPLDALIALVEELHVDNDPDIDVRAYTNCNRYGLPANAMLRVNYDIAEGDAVAVDTSGRAYAMDYDHESLDFMPTDKTTKYITCPQGKAIDKETFAVTAMRQGLAQRLGTRMKNFDLGCLGYLWFWVFLIIAVISGRLARWIDFPDYLTDTVVNSLIIGIIVISIGICSLLHRSGHTKIQPTTMLTILGTPIVLCILANYFITTEQRDREATIVKSDDDEMGTWVCWQYADDGTGFGIHDDATQEEFKQLDACIVDWRRGVLGWPVVRGIRKKE